MQVAPHESQVRVENLQLLERGLGLPHSVELGQAGDDIAQAGRPIPIERPGPSPGLNRLEIVSQSVVRARESRQPDKQARILGAEANALFGKRDRLLRMASVEVHLAKQNMGGGIAGVELDRFVERRHRAVGAMRPHADEAQREMGCRVAGIEYNRTLGEFISLDVIEFVVFYPT